MSSNVVKSLLQYRNDRRENGRLELENTFEKIAETRKYNGVEQIVRGKGSTTPD